MWKPWSVIIVCFANNKDSISFFRFSNLQWKSAFTKVPSIRYIFTQIVRLFYVLSQIGLSEFEFLSFVRIWVFEFYHNLSFWFLSKFEFTSFVIIWVFEFSHKLGLVTIWVVDFFVENCFFVKKKKELWKSFFLIFF